MKKPGAGAFIFVLCFSVFLYNCAGNSVANSAGVPPVNADKAKPAWVDSPEAVYNRNSFVAGVGAGNERGTAEQNALAALSSIFHQSLREEETITSSYQEAVKNGAAAGWIENTSVEGIIKTSTAM